MNEKPNDNAITKINNEVKYRKVKYKRIGTQKRKTTTIIAINQTKERCQDKVSKIIYIFMLCVYYAIYIDD